MKDLYDTEDFRLKFVSAVVHPYNLTPYNHIDFKVVLYMLILVFIYDFYMHICLQIWNINILMGIIN